MNDNYLVVTKPDSKQLEGQDWFNECVLITESNLVKKYGREAYFVPIDRYEELFNIID